MGSIQVDEKAVFNAARLIADAEARESYLFAACRDDAAALARIRELLRVHAEEASFLESPAVASAAPEAPLESPGTVIGPYKLLEQIGEGGFGVVFMAEQTAPVRRRVALKVIKPGMDTKQVIGRFEAERQALALMDHPNIARVLDAGTTGTGRPYFVMELVRGVPITEYCDAHRLTPRQRLELFVTVCHAVQHAHQKGIIHRDLKPSNVLVTLHDDRPVVKVIDFGIAKATGEQLTEKTLFTAFAQMIGTPLYMSPEQASMGGLDIDTRSDVYSLGVLLYELLTGSTPFEKARLKEAAFDEIRRIIREEEPARPSARLSTSGTLPSVAASRGTEPAKLTRLVRGDLDWIAMKALEKDRTRRYETASGLAMDVKRYLSCEAVSACPPSAAYRLRKLARRHKGALAVAALAGAMLLVVAGSVGWIARDEAARRGRTAEAVAVLLDQCDDALRAEATDRAAVALDAAERRAAEGGAEGLGDRLARCRADLRLLRELDAIDTGRWTWTNDGFRGDRAPAQWRAALAEYGVSLEQDHVAHAAERVNGSLARERVLAALERWLPAGQLMGADRHRVESGGAAAASMAVDRDSLAGVRALLHAVDPEPYRDAVRDAIAAGDMPAVVALAGKPEALTQPARFVAVLGMFRDVPVDRRQVLLESALRSRPSDTELLLCLGQACDRRPEEAARWLQAAVAAHPTNVAALCNLAVVLCSLGELDGALAFLEEAIRIDPAFANGHRNLGFVFARRGDHKRAVTSYEEAIRLDPENVLAHNNMGVALLDLGERERAVACFREAIRLDPAGARQAYVNMGRALLDPAEAIPYLRKGVELDPSDPFAHSQLALRLAITGNLVEAEAEVEEVLRLDPDSRAAADSCCSLGGALSEREPARAVAYLEKTLRLNPGSVEAHINMGRARRAQGDRKAAIACYEAAIRLDPHSSLAHYHLGEVIRDDPPAAASHFREAIELDPGYALARSSLGIALCAMGDDAHAIPEFEAALRLNSDLATAHSNLGDALARRGDIREAIAHLEEAVRLDPWWPTAWCNLGCCYEAVRDLDKAVFCFEKAIGVDPAFAGGHVCLGAILMNRDPARALKELQKAVELDPGDVETRCNLGTLFYDQHEFDRAIACFREATRIDPRHVISHYNLGNGLLALGKTEEAIACYRDAIRLDPGYAPARYNLADTLLGIGDAAGAVPHLREAVRLEPSDQHYYYELGLALQTTGDLAGAVDAYRKAIDLKPDYAEAHCNLGLALLDLGCFAEGLESLRRGDELGRQRPDWSHPSGGWVHRAEDLVALEARLPGVLSGQAARPDEQIALANICLHFRKRYADAALLYGRAFAAEPRLVGLSPHRYNAARAAALAGCGQGVGADGIGSSERARLRGLAVDWLRAELVAFGDRPASDPAAAEEVRNALQRWLGDPDLSGVRDAQGLSALPDDERQLWTKLWQNARDLKAHTEGK